MNDGHRTSTIPRPSDPTRTSSAPASDHSTFSDFTVPIARDKQLVKGQGKRLVIAGAAVVIVAALVAALFVLPVKAWLRQRDDIDRKQTELAILDQANAELSRDVRRLQTPEGIKEAARQEIGYVEPGEIRLTVLPAPAAPLALPGGWPYDVVAQIITVRSTPVVTTAP